MVSLQKEPPWPLDSTYMTTWFIYVFNNFLSQNMRKLNSTLLHPAQGCLNTSTWDRTAYLWHLRKGNGFSPAQKSDLGFQLTSWNHFCTTSMQHLRHWANAVVRSIPTGSWITEAFSLARLRRFRHPSTGTPGVKEEFYYGIRQSEELCLEAS